MPSDFPLEAGEKPPCVRRRGNGKCRVEVSQSSDVRMCLRPGAASEKLPLVCLRVRLQDDDSQRSKPKKTLFSGALRKHSDPEHNTHSQTHTHHGKRTVHRGCHTGNTLTFNLSPGTHTHRTPASSCFYSESVCASRRHGEVREQLHVGLNGTRQR